MSPASSQRTMLRLQPGSRKAFINTYNPDYQLRICNSPTLCVVGDYPTLTDIKLSYGDNASAAWLVPQLVNLSEYCGCKEKLQGKPLEECAHIISMEYGHLKISELMLFFYWFKAGKFGKFYGSVDPLVITTSLREFMKERALLIERYELERKQRADEEARKNKITWEEFCRERGREGEIHPLALKPEEKKEKSEEIDVSTALTVAESIVGNDNGLSDSSLAMMRRLFARKYGCDPEEYVKKHKEQEI